MIEAEPTVVAVTGMKRSGTTFQYNTCRLACEIAGYNVWAGGPAPDAFDAMEGPLSEVYVVKEHRWRPALANISNYVFTASRDMDEVRESMRRFRDPPSEPKTKKWNEWLRRWRWCSSWHQPYELLSEDPVECVRKHVEILGLPVDIGRLTDQLALEILPPEETRQDDDSLVFESHYQSEDPSKLARTLKAAPSE